MSDNLPKVRLAELEYNVMLAGAKMLKFPGNNTVLGTACRKRFRVSCLAVVDKGGAAL